MRILVRVLAVDLVVVAILVALIFRGTIRMYRGGVIVSLGLLVLNAWILRKGLAAPTTQIGDRAADFGRVGTTALMWAYSIACVIAIAMAVATKDAAYLIQAGIGAVLVGCMLFILRALDRKRKGSKP